MKRADRLLVNFIENPAQAVAVRVPMKRADRLLVNLPVLLSLISGESSRDVL